MRQAHLITFGLDDQAAARLQPIVAKRGGAVRVTRQLDACVNMLRLDAGGVLLLRIGKDLELEFGLLAQAAVLFPRVAVVVVGDLEHARLTGLAWDLGARAVFLPATEPERLHDALLRLLSE